MKWILTLIAWVMGFFNTKIIDPMVGYVVSMPTLRPTIVVDAPSPVPTIKKIVSKVVPSRVGDTGAWGVAQQISEHTWTMKIGDDERMGTPKEILDALNDYRVRRGSQRLTWNDNLANYAQSRADFIISLGKTDEHKGFADFLENQNGYEKLGFSWLGENISIGYRVLGVHLIEWVYAGDKPHDDNQVNNRWNYVGIGVKGTATALIFGTGKR